MFRDVSDPCRVERVVVRDVKVRGPFGRRRKVLCPGNVDDKGDGR